MVKFLFQKWHENYYKWKPKQYKKCVYCWKEYVKSQDVSHKQWGKSQRCSRKCFNTMNIWRKLTDEHKKKIGAKSKWHKLSQEAKEKIRQAHIWKKRTYEQIKRLSDAHKWKKSPIKNIPRPHKSWENHWNWKGGISSENKRIRRSIKYRLWREAIFTRDNYICQKCKAKWIYLHPHHICWYAEHPDLRFSIDNWITLCKKCHNEFHKKYGNKGINKTQIIDFIS